MYDLKGIITIAGSLLGCAIAIWFFVRGINLTTKDKKDSKNNSGSND